MSLSHSDTYHEAETDPKEIILYLHHMFQADEQRESSAAAVDLSALFAPIFSLESVSPRALSFGAPYNKTKRHWKVLNETEDVWSEGEEALHSLKEIVNEAEQEMDKDLSMLVMNEATESQSQESIERKQVHNLDSIVGERLGMVERGDHSDAEYMLQPMETRAFAIQLSLA